MFFYGYGDKFRRDWMNTMVGEPSRLASELDFALGGLDFQGDTGEARTIGDIPFNLFARAISAARVNLNMTRRPHATVAGSSTARPFESRRPAPRSSRTRTTGSRALVRARPRARDRRERRGCRGGVPRARRRPRAGRGDGRRARERVLDEHTYAHRARQAPRARRARGRSRSVSEGRLVAIVPAWNESGAIGGVVDEIRAFDARIDVVVVDDASATTPRRSPEPTADGARAAVQRRHRRCRADGIPVRTRRGVRGRRAPGRRRPARRVRAREAPLPD